MKISSRLGRTVYKEQFMFLYRWEFTCSRTFRLIWVQRFHFFEYVLCNKNRVSLQYIMIIALDHPDHFSLTPSWSRYSFIVRVCVCVCAGRMWLKWWTPISLMTCRLQEKMFSTETPTSWDSNVQIQVWGFCSPHLNVDCCFSRNAERSVCIKVMC